MTGVQKVLPKCGPAGGHFALLSYKVGSGKNCLTLFKASKQPVSHVKLENNWAVKGGARTTDLNIFYLKRLSEDSKHPGLKIELENLGCQGWA